MRRVSRNGFAVNILLRQRVTPRMRRVSRNNVGYTVLDRQIVTPRMRRVSRNRHIVDVIYNDRGHASHEACE